MRIYSVPGSSQSSATVSIAVSSLPGRWWLQIDLIRDNASYLHRIFHTASPNHENFLLFLPCLLAQMYYPQGLHGSKDDLQEKKYHYLLSTLGQIHGGFI